MKDCKVSSPKHAADVADRHEVVNNDRTSEVVGKRRTSDKRSGENRVGRPPLPETSSLTPSQT